MHWSKNPKIREQVVKKLSLALKGRISPRKGVKLSREMRRRMSIARLGKPSGVKGYKFTDQQRENCRIAFRKWYRKEKHYNFGRKLSKETCLKKSASLKKAFVDGRMKYMKKVWDEGRKRWLGKNNPRWSGGWYVDKYNYRFVHDDKNRWRKEHRVVAERIIGRDLKRSETIHHINGNKLDNRPRNLYYFPNDNLHKSYHGLKNRQKLFSNLTQIE